MNASAVAVTIPSAGHVVPKQERSSRTLDRIVRAAEELLAQRPFEEITIADIVRRSRSSIGSFYARFDSKEALLPYLYDRYDRELRDRLAPRLDPSTWQGLDLRTMCRRGVALMVDMYRERQWLLRAVALYARAHPERLGADVRQRRKAMHDEQAALFRPHVASITHSAAEKSVAFGLFVVASACRERILFSASPHASATRITDEQLKQELADMLYYYLTAARTEGA
ncbi:MAG TPA: helix-turn-helix domain-containing protein [Gemmatimonadaceae bacterium]|nr:helix-turn-helix domain-containing protein [Gemmatimonadaceae bacterium]